MKLNKIKLADLTSQPAQRGIYKSLVREITRKEIAIIGISFRLPYADSIREYENNLCNGFECVKPFPEKRKLFANNYLKLKNVRQEHLKYSIGGYIDDVDSFDYEFFGILPREASLMDPQQRLFLQVAWKAIEDGGYGGDRLKDTRTGVYIGHTPNTEIFDYKQIMTDVAFSYMSMAIPGNLASLMPTRIGYFLNLRGPGLVVDTACSSSLVAIHLACQAIRNNECDYAVAGGVKLSLFPLQDYGKIGIESSDGRTRAFDDNADGTGIGEGIAALLLKPLHMAIEDNDDIYAVIKGSAVNQDGASAGITAPNVISQQDVMVRAWKNAGIDPETIAYIEAHGTGTTLGDPIEAQSIAQAFREFTSEKHFCAIGSVKSNIGHLHAASGIAGLLKCILSLQNKKLYPSINCERPNRNIRLKDSPIYVNKKLQNWKKGSVPRRCGVNSFGFSGTNCHVVLEEVPARKNRSQGSDGCPQIFTLSAKNPEVLAQIVIDYRKLLAEVQDCDEITISDICYTANTARGHYNDRLAIIAHDKQGLLDILNHADSCNTDSDNYFCGIHQTKTADPDAISPCQCLVDDIRYRMDKAKEALIDLLGSRENPQGYISAARRICRLYVEGANISWNELYAQEQRNILHLPAYSFNNTGCTIEIPEMVTRHEFFAHQKTHEQPTEVPDEQASRQLPAIQLAGRKDNDYSPAERAVGEIWGLVCGFKEINVSDNFFRLGGESIALMQIIQRVNDQLNVYVSMSDFVQNSSIEALACLTDRQKGEARMPVYPQHEPDPGNMHKPFPLTDIQMAYLMGRDSSFELGGIGTHIYTEVRTHRDIEKLNLALQKVIKRHPMLRAVFAAETQQQQILEQAPPYDIEYEDISFYTKNVQMEHILKERDRMSHHTFDPAKWPLFRLKAFKLSEKENYILFGYDMLIADGLSIQIFERDLVRFYDNPALKLPRLDFSFRDYVMAYEDFKGSDTYANDRQFHMQRIDDLPYGPSIPVKQSPSSIQSPHFSRKQETFSHEQWQQLKDAARKLKITPSALLLTAYAKTLRFWSNQDKFTINLTVFNRYPFHESVNQIVGDFTSVMLLVVSLKSSDTLEETAWQIHRNMIENLEHRHYDGVRIIREMAKRDNAGAKAITPVVFTSMLPEDVITKGNGSDPIGDLVYGISQTSQVFLDNQISERNNNLSITWDYADNILDSALIDMMFDQYIGMIRALIDGKPIPMPCLTEKDKQVICQYNQTDREFMLRPLHEMFVEQAMHTPEQPCVVSEGETISYADLDKKSNQIAHYLIEQGVKKNSCVGVLTHRDSDTVVNIMGILKAGGAYVPVEPDYPDERKNYILSNSEVKIVLNSDFYNSNNMGRYSSENPGRESSLDDLAYIIYTSGSTGRPKGVMIKHKAAANTIVDINRKFAIDKTHKIIGLSSICFDLSVYDIFGSLSTGAVLHMATDITNTDSILDVIVDSNITFWNSVPSVMNLLIENISINPNIQHNTFESLRHVLLSGDWIPPDLPSKIKKYFPNSNITSLGGATEASIWSIYYPIDEVKPEWKSIPYGIPLSNQKCYVLNDDLDLCPLGVRGELCIGGAGIANGYMNDQEKTRNAFIAHPELGDLYKTGDYGIHHKQGYIEFLGRKDSQVKIRGHRIELGEIEANLLQHPEIKEAVVVAAELGDKDKRLVAYTAPSNIYGLTPQSLRDYLKERLPSYMIPYAFVILDSLPLTPNGKVDRKRLPDPDLDARESAEQIVIPRNEIDIKVLEIWKDILKKDKISIHDNFFELGGDSLQVYQIAMRAEAEYKIKIPIDSLYKEPTVANVSDFIQEVLENKVPSETEQIAAQSEHPDDPDDKYFWSPAVHWQQGEGYLKIGDTTYEPLNIFPEFYFLTQNGITLQALKQEFSNINQDRFDSFINQMIANKSVVKKILTWHNVFSPQKNLFNNKYDKDLLFDKEKYNVYINQQMNREQTSHLGKSIGLQFDENLFPLTIAGRKSYRNFQETDLISFASFSNILAIFRQRRNNGKIKYYYASSGALYPIDIYLYVKENRVQNVEQGLYYYNPAQHKLNLIDKNIITEKSAYVKNKEIFKSSAFTVYMIYNAEASMPLYGSDGYFYACLDTGIMVGVLTHAAELFNVGLCSIGDQNFEIIKDSFNLTNSQVLLHTVELGLKPERVLTFEEVVESYNMNKDNLE